MHIRGGRYMSTYIYIHMHTQRQYCVSSLHAQAQMYGFFLGGGYMFSPQKKIGHNSKETIYTLEPLGVYKRL